uniref:Putative secreted protein n=1 Tax=Anopheles darlingi TaxID=43151 RepID=A0A2M4D5S8_ANODA
MHIIPSPLLIALCAFVVLLSDVSDAGGCWPAAYRQTAYRETRTARKKKKEKPKQNIHLTFSYLLPPTIWFPPI